jgi:hypothetical protein
MLVPSETGFFVSIISPCCLYDVVVICKFLGGGSVDWFRWHHGSVSDPKFQWVARRSSVSVATVIAVWACILERASMSARRGCIDGFDCEDIDVLLGLDDGNTEAVVRSMRDKGILTEDCINNWASRQPLREDSAAAERKRRQRDKSVISDMSHNVTQSHAESPSVTENSARLDKIRLEDNREEQPLAPKKKRRVSVPKTDQSLFSSWWCMSFLNTEGFAYSFTAKGAGIIANLLASVGDVRKLMLRACRFFITDDEFHRGKKTLGMFSAEINKMPPVTNGELGQCRDLGILPPDGIKLEDWKFWEVADESENPATV